MNLLQEHDKREKKVFGFLNEVIRESNFVFFEHENKFIVPLRIQLIISFSLLDVLASFYSEYNGVHETQKNRFLLWSKKYCFSKENKEYKNNNIWSNLDENFLYKLRNSLVHFFGITQEHNGFYISVANNNITFEKMDQFKNEFLKKGFNVLFIKPHDLHKLIKDAGILMIEEWRKILENNKTNINEDNPHIRGVLNLLKKIELDGAFPV